MPSYSQSLVLKLGSICLICCAVSVMAGCGSKPETHFDVGVAKFEIPEGWVTSDGKGESVVFLTKEEEEEKITEIISIDIFTPPKDSTFLEAANAYAGRHNGKINPEGLMIDGAKAIHVEIPKQSSLGPTDCFVVLGNGKACFINGGTITAEPILPTLKKIIETWKWADDAK